ncbi:hypothetical protein Patl1_13228 [Pistacia atlantica]|uniref:Uncharacterized protein n=1 Tax=Pistacia atlantica TaxID=434234 RepID=A0ACC1AV40_9ROSI|nr:hypothetical protein Patl1_13228 [Pistacia atlantica]
MFAVDWQLNEHKWPNATLVFSRPKLHFEHLSWSSSSNSPEPWLSLTPLMFRSLVKLLTSLVSQPAASVTTILYYSELLPQNIVLERMVRHELLEQENYLFHFLVNFLRCFW